MSNLLRSLGWRVSRRIGRRREDFSMVRRGWRDLLYLGQAPAEAKANCYLHLRKAAPSGTIENVRCELPPETKRKIKKWYNTDNSIVSALYQILNGKTKRQTKTQKIATYKTLLGFKKSTKETTEPENRTAKFFITETISGFFSPSKPPSTIAAPISIT